MLSRIWSLLDPAEWITHEELMLRFRQALRSSDHQVVTDCIARLAARGRLPAALNEPPLVLRQASVYPNIIKLLELGARPELRDAKTPAMNMFLSAAATRNLTLFRLLLWFEADEPSNQYEIAITEKPTPFAFQRWQENNSRISAILKGIADDFRQVRQQRLLAEQDVNHRHYQAAGRRYAAIAEICEKHCRIEQAVVRNDKDRAAHIEAVPAFFHEKAVEFQKEAYKYLQLADAVQQESEQPLSLSDQIKQDRRQVLTILAKLASVLGETHAAAAYQARADRLAPPLERDSRSISEGEDPTVAPGSHPPSAVALVLRQRPRSNPATNALPRYSTTDPVELDTANLLP